MGMTDFIGGKRGKDQAVENFDELAQGKTKEEVRGLERELLKPEPVPEYVDEPSTYRINADMTVKVVFPSQEAMDLVARHFSITKYIEASIPRIDLLLDFLRWIESGEVKYDKEKHSFIYIGKPEPVEQSFGIRRRRFTK